MWNVAYSSVVDVYGRFVRSCCHHNLPRWWRQQERLTRCHIPENNTLHGHCCDNLKSLAVFTAIWINQYGWIILPARDISLPRIKRSPCRSNSKFRTVACGPVLEPEWPTYNSDLATSCTVRSSIPCVGVIYSSVLQDIQTASAAASLPIKCMPAILSSGVKRPGREAEDSLQRG